MDDGIMSAYSTFFFSFFQQLFTLNHHTSIKQRNTRGTHTVHTAGPVLGGMRVFVLGGMRVLDLTTRPQGRGW
jgi:hypothetical protein